MNNILVVGGGAAGWLVALFMKKLYPNKSVKVIESSEIGILGAGESTLGIFVRFIKQELDLDVLEMIAKTNGTIKIGTHFNNWGPRDYTFPFSSEEHDIEAYHEIYSNVIASNGRLEDISVNGERIRQFKVPFMKNGSTDIVNLGNHAINLDASLLAKFLKEKALKRGIVVIDAIVDSFNEDNQGNIISCVLKNNDIIPCDFIFDCSGQRREIIGKHYKVEWSDHTDSLPLDSALPFFMKRNGEPTPSAIETRALSSGWVWKTPLTHRYGCGYVFDSSYQTFEEAEKEVRSIYGDDILIPTTFKYKAGYYKTPWVNNSVAIGVSSGFLEPLEASSMLMIIMSLQHLKETNSFECYNQSDRDCFNEMFVSLNEIHKAFVYVHYLGGKTDSPFWKELKEKTTVPRLAQLFLDYQSKLMEDSTYSLLVENKTLSKVYSPKIWAIIMQPLGLVGQNYNLYSVPKYTRERYFDFINKTILNSMSHDEFLLAIKEKYLG